MLNERGREPALPAKPQLVQKRQSSSVHHGTKAFPRFGELDPASHSMAKRSIDFRRRTQLDQNLKVGLCGFERIIGDGDVSSAQMSKAQLLNFGLPGARHLHDCALDDLTGVGEKPDPHEVINLGSCHRKIGG
jgi:hypothetical protein